MYWNECKNTHGDTTRDKRENSFKIRNHKENRRCSCRHSVVKITIFKQSDSKLYIQPGQPSQPVSADTCLWALQAGHLFMAFYHCEDGGCNITVTCLPQAAVGCRCLREVRRGVVKNPVPDRPGARAARVRRWSVSPASVKCAVIHAVMVPRWPGLSGCALPLQLAARQGTVHQNFSSRGVKVMLTL